MNELMGFLLSYGYWLTLGSVFLEQMGLPLPAVPILLGMGALSRSENVSFVAVNVIAVAGTLAADLVWYYLGRRYGRAVLTMICRVSLEPDFCVRRTEDAFLKRGIWTIPLAKFVPGLNAAAVPLAGMIKIGLVRFMAVDAAGAIAWTGAYSTLGYMFSNQLERIIIYLSQFGDSLLVLVGAIIAAYISYKYTQRRRFLKTLAIERITPDELKSIMDLNERVVVMDLRNQLDVDMDRFRIPGAFHALPEILSRRGDIPRDQEVVLYCSCPNEATSARVAQRLRRLGVVRVRPLAGGFRGWRDRGFPIDPLDEA
jgi:membrane protein DedA with SNARE-associated domain/rhodanese-related sulfurtransferase